MATPTTFERQWPAVLLSPITVANHVITVSSTAGLHTHATVVLSKPGEETKEYIVNKIYSDTELSVAATKASFPVRVNPTQFTGGTLAMPEQNRNPIASEYLMRAVYAEEPTVALRTVQVDRWGQFYTTDNPMPVQLSDGSINIGTVNAELEVQLSHLDDYPNTGDVHDSIRIGGRNNGPELVVNPDGSINANIVEAETNPAQNVINEYGESGLVAANTETVVVSYVVPAGTTARLQRVEFSGKNIGHYRVYINGTCVSSRRTHHGSGLTGEFVYAGGSEEGLPLEAGDTVELTVLHERPISGLFEGRLQALVIGTAILAFMLLEDGFNLLQETGSRLIT